jgi:hypothetical protein
MAKPPCDRCGEACRTEKPVYGWVCANCVYELDRHYVVLGGLEGGDLIQRYLHDRDHGKLPPPGRRGPSVNVRKPWIG